MTIEEVAAFVGERRVIRHKGQVFVNLHTHDDAELFRVGGANVLEHVIRGRVVVEAHLAPMLDAPTERDDEGELIDNRATIALDYFRERDGDALGIAR